MGVRQSVRVVDAVVDGVRVVEMRSVVDDGVRERADGEVDWWVGDAWRRHPPLRECSCGVGESGFEWWCARSDLDADTPTRSRSVPKGGPKEVPKAGPKEHVPKEAVQRGSRGTPQAYGT